MREISLHILDIAENSVSAQATHILISVDEDTAADRLRVSVVDDGKGMDSELAARVTDPFTTSRTTRKVGLGIPLLKEAAEACGGFLRVASRPDEGTTIEVEFQLSHIDRMPLGNLQDTFFSLFIAFPNIHWTFRYFRDGGGFYFDDAEMKEELVGVSLSEPQILQFFRDLFENGMNSLKKA